MSVKFEFTLEDEEAVTLLDLLHEEKCRLVEGKQEAEHVTKNPNMAKWFDKHMKYLEGLKNKILAGQTRLDK